MAHRSCEGQAGSWGGGWRVEVCGEAVRGRRCEEQDKVIENILGHIGEKVSRWD